MLVEFTATIAASLGQFLDARTTQVALNAKVGREANFVSRFLIGRLGFTGYYISKVLLLPAMGLAVQSTSTLFYIGAFGIACAVWNYLIVLRKNKLSIF
jgi:hypothetical protein